MRRGITCWVRGEYEVREKRVESLPEKIKGKESGKTKM
jgi:hypothetical protein